MINKNLLEKYKNFLIHKNRNISKLTLKNYISDINKFITWTEKQNLKKYNLKNLDYEIIEVYKKYLINNNISEKSINRYISSLRSYFNFLEENNHIIVNPFKQKIVLTNNISNDTLNEFKISLLSNNLSKSTVKNYLIDISQFIDWLKIVSPEDLYYLLDQDKTISPLIIEEYVSRLTHDRKLDAISINRKLSALRKYFFWLKHQDFNIQSNIKPANKKVQKYKTGLELLYEIKNKYNSISNEDKTQEAEGNTNAFTKLLNNLLDATLIIPISKTIEKIGYLKWNLINKKIFVPTESLISNNINPQIIKENTQDNTYFKKNNNNIKTPIALTTLKISKNINMDIPGIPKSVYAPLNISTKGLPKSKKLIYHLRYTRPKWYKKYHSYPIINYIHLGILIIFMTVIGTLIYNSFYEMPKGQSAAIANQSNSPPKILAFQGKLTDKNNNPINVATPLRFSIYNDQTASGSSLLWQETQTVNPNPEGNFSTALGSNNSLPSSIFSNNSNLYLGMSIGTGKELQPRQQVATIAYSKDSEKLQGLSPITTNNSTSNVILALNSAGDLTIGGKASPTFEATGGQFTISGKTLLLKTALDSNSNVQISPDGLGIIDIQKPIQNTTNNNNIYTAQGAVEIDDSLAILATSSGQSAFTVNQNSTGPIISASSSGIAKFTVESSGNGIFAGNLYVNGNFIDSQSNSFKLLNKVSSLSLANSANNISIGSSKGSTTINNSLIASNGITINKNKLLIVKGYIGSNLNPNASNKYNLGSPTNRWNNAYIDNLYTNPLASVSGFWQRNKEQISLINQEYDFVLAGNSSEEGKFKIIGSGTNAGTASTSGQITFINNSQINLLNKSNFGFYNSTYGDKGLNTKPALYISNNGNIGIGTNNPTSTLDVNGDIQGKNLTLLKEGAINFENNGEKITQIKGINTTKYGSSLIFSTKSNTSTLAEKMRLDNNGSLILGSEQANATLDVHGNSGILPIASLSGSTALAAFIIDNSGKGDLLSASSSGLTRFVITQNGNVGIGEENPTNKLKIVGSACISKNIGACSGNTPGTIYADNTAISNADLAENYISSEELEPGDIVMIENKDSNYAVTKTDSAYQIKSIGIVSTKPGITLNSNAEIDNSHPYTYPIALTGRIPVKISSENGNIQPGDYITSSSRPGVGMKATKTGIVIGKALESYSNSDPNLIGKILIFANLSSIINDNPPNNLSSNINYIGQSQINNQIDNSILNQATILMNSVIAKIKNEILQANKIVTNTLDVTTDNITIGGEALSNYISRVTTNIAMRNIKYPQDNPNIKLNIISPLASNSAISLEINKSELLIRNNESTDKKIVATVDNHGNASFSGTITSNGISANNATISGTLHVHNLIADNIQSGTKSATYITNVTNIYNNISTISAATSEINTSSNSGYMNNKTSTDSAIQSSSNKTIESPDINNNLLLNTLKKNQTINNNFIETASLSSSFINEPTINTKFTQFSHGLISYGNSMLSDTSIIGQLNIGGSFIIENNAINTLGNELKIQPLRQANISLMNNLVSIDTDGNLKVSGNATFAKDVTIKGKITSNMIAPMSNSNLTIELPSQSQENNLNQSNLVIQNSSASAIVKINQTGDLISSGSGKFIKLSTDGLSIVRGAQADTSLTQTVASSSAGTAIITKYETERTIITPFVKKDSLIYLTATSDTQGLTPYIARQTLEDAQDNIKGSFTIAIKYPINKDIKINWWIIN